MGLQEGRLAKRAVVPKGHELSIAEARQCQLAILDSVHRFCEGRGLAYFLTGGSLLGAVRHGGYVPWDDDIDVAMPRADYERFVKGYADEANPHLAVLSMHGDPDYYLPFAKVVDLRTVLEEEIDRAPAIGVYVDVFPVDNLSNDYGRAVRLFRVVRRYRWLLLAKNLTPAGHRHWAKNAVLIVAKALLAPIPRRRVLQSIDRLSRRYETSRPTRYAGVVCCGTYGLGEIVESEVLAHRVPCRFEGREYYIPADYDRLLRGLYGDYMTPPPPSERVSHHRARAWWAAPVGPEKMPDDRISPPTNSADDVDVAISVILPVYNVEPHLEECLESVLAQTFADFELIAVDDGSTDGCAAILDAYAARDSRMSVLHQPNRGLSAARNAGIEVARGRYLAFVDSDDYLHPRMLERLLAATDGAGVAIAMCDYYYVAEGSPDLCRRPFRSLGGLVDEREYWRRASLAETGEYEFVWNKLWRRNVFGHARFAEGKLFEDTIILYDVIAGNGPVAVVDEPLYYHRVRRGSITHSEAPNPGAALPLAWALVGRDEGFRGRGWGDLRAYNLRHLVCRLMQVYEHYDLLDPDERDEYAALRAEARRILWEAWPQLAVRPAQLARVAPFVVDERLRVVVQGWYRQLRRRGR